MSRTATTLGLIAFIAACDSKPGDAPAGTAPPPAVSAENQLQPQREDRDPARVDMYGRWERFEKTPDLREEALERIAGLPSFGFGRAATVHEIAAIDIDVMPDGTGLPDGSGTVARGKDLYANQCVQCHGADGRGADFEALVGREPREGFPFADSLDYTITVGNYWPYATTLFDYIRRAMPQAVPGSLPAEDVYSLVAYILYLNEIVPEETSLDQDSLPNIVMPARDRFVYDDRRGGPELR